jgi:hypothetical protein
VGDAITPLHHPPGVEEFEVAKSGGVWVAAGVLTPNSVYTDNNVRVLINNADTHYAGVLDVLD